MYVYHEIDGSFIVGFYMPNGKFYKDSEVKTKEEARQIVNYLNGGAT